MEKFFYWILGLIFIIYIISNILVLNKFDQKIIKLETTSIQIPTTTNNRYLITENGNVLKRVKLKSGKFVYIVVK